MKNLQHVAFVKDFFSFRNKLFRFPWFLHVAHVLIFHRSPCIYNKIEITDSKKNILQVPLLNRMKQSRETSICF